MTHSSKHDARVVLRASAYASSRLRVLRVSLVASVVAPDQPDEGRRLGVGRPRTERVRGCGETREEHALEVVRGDGERRLRALHHHLAREGLEVQPIAGSRAVRVQGDAEHALDHVGQLDSVDAIAAASTSFSCVRLVAGGRVCADNCARAWRSGRPRRSPVRHSARRFRQSSCSDFCAVASPRREAEEASQPTCAPLRSLAQFPSPSPRDVATPPASCRARPRRRRMSPRPPPWCSSPAIEAKRSASTWPSVFTAPPLADSCDVLGGRGPVRPRDPG